MWSSSVLFEVMLILNISSGAGTNSKVVGTSPARSDVKILLVVPLHFFLAPKVQFVVLLSAFVMVSTVQFGQFQVCRSPTHGVPCE